MSAHRTQTIRIDGRPRAYLEKRRVRRREYYLLERIGSPFRERYLAFDPLAGRRGNFFQVQSLRMQPETEQQLSVLDRLKHDAFPRVVEWQPRKDHVDVVLNWISGVSLSDYFEHVRAGRRPPPNPGEALRLIECLARAIGILHRKCQVVHGDIQPANIVLTSQTSRLVLIDFGSAWVQQQAATRCEGDGLDPAYAAPELQTPPYRGSFASDQFSVSVLLFELLTQQLPYHGLGGKAGVPAITQGKPIGYSPPSELSEGCRRLPGSLRSALDELTRRGLALAASERYPHPNAWQQQLFELSTAFRLPPQLTLWERCLTRVAGWWSRQSA